MGVFDGVFIFQVHVVQCGFAAPGKDLFGKGEESAALDLREEVDARC
jgi:hypothetical protein